MGPRLANTQALVLLCLIASTGCAFIPLRRNTINQARTVSDIHQQQVVDNLAMFVFNPNSMPCFSYPTQGTNQVTNTTTGGVSTGWGAITQGPVAGKFLLNALGITVNGQHQSNEAFTLVPINDPRKLELMRCAYQRPWRVADAGHRRPPVQTARRDSMFSIRAIPKEIFERRPAAS